MRLKIIVLLLAAFAGGCSKTPCKEYFVEYAEYEKSWDGVGIKKPKFVVIPHRCWKQAK